MYKKYLGYFFVFDGVMVVSIKSCILLHYTAVPLSHVKPDTHYPIERTASVYRALLIWQSVFVRLFSTLLTKIFHSILKQMW